MVSFCKKNNKGWFDLSFIIIYLLIVVSVSSLLINQPVVD